MRTWAYGLREEEGWVWYDYGPAGRWTPGIPTPTDDVVVDVHSSELADTPYFIVGALPNGWDDMQCRLKNVPLADAVEFVVATRELLLK